MPPFTTLILAIVLSQPALEGWSEGQVAAGSQATLAHPEPMPVTLPEEIASHIEGETLLLYFSPGCPHCRDVAPDFVRLTAEKGDELNFLWVASGGSFPEDVETFRQEFGITSAILIDHTRVLPTTFGLRSTPVGLLMRRDDDGVKLLTGWLPWFKGADVLLEMFRNPEQPYVGFTPGRYLGNTVCQGCHTQEALSWAMTHHASAYATIYRDERTEEEECVRCHVTGLGEGGFVMGDHASDHSGVTCEACHTPGGPHDGVSGDATAVCEGCHDADHSIAFSLERGLPHIDHFFANSMSEEELQERWRSLRSGQAERPLLAFQTGPNAGSAACQSCHPDEHSRWQAGPHANAMATLTGELSDDPSCVRCHATATSSGPTPTTIEGFFTAEGVSCESCHGPGVDHAANPTLENILRLGSTCPECVLNEVCTSCHTTAWDPTWDLDEHLGRLRSTYRGEATEGGE